MVPKPLERFPTLYALWLFCFSVTLNASVCYGQRIIRDNDLYGRTLASKSNTFGHGEFFSFAGLSINLKSDGKISVSNSVVNATKFKYDGTWAFSGNRLTIDVKGTFTDPDYTLVCKRLLNLKQSDDNLSFSGEFEGVDEFSSSEGTEKESKNGSIAFAIRGKPAKGDSKFVIPDGDLVDLDILKDGSRESLLAKLREKEAIGIIYSFSGKVSIERAGVVKPIDPQSGMVMRKGDLLRVTDGKAAYINEEGVLVRVNANSVIEFGTHDEPFDAQRGELKSTGTRG